MHVPLIVFLRAIGLYLLFTLPSVAVPFIYAYSAFLAIVFGLAAGAAFICCYLLIAQLDVSYHLKFRLLLLCIPAGVTLSYVLIGFFHAAEDLWGFNFFLVFPGIAVIAGWASLFIGRRAVRQHLDPAADDIQLLLKP